VSADLLKETIQLRYPRLLVSGDIPYKVRPLMADWMARQLGAAAA